MGLGWAGISNGGLLRRAHSRYDALVTMNSNIEYQQNLSPLALGVIVAHAASNRLVHLQPLMPAILAALAALAPGALRTVGA